MTGCLFDLKHDHTEQHEVSAANPAVVARMIGTMEQLAATIWSASHGNDPLCHGFCERHYGGFYGPWKELDAWGGIREKQQREPVF